MTRLCGDIITIPVSTNGLSISATTSDDPARIETVIVSGLLLSHCIFNSQEKSKDHLFVNSNHSSAHSKNTSEMIISGGVDHTKPLYTTHGLLGCHGALFMT